MKNRVLATIALALLTAACSDTTGPEYRYDGHWQGTVGEGGTITFTVADNGMAPIEVTYPHQKCNGGGFGRISPPVQVGGGSFQISSSADTVTITGRFESEARASGEVRWNSPCGDPAETWSWTAAKQ
jgi:hypothetical protein